MEIGQLWHTLRVGGGNWQPEWGSVNNWERNDPGQFKATAAAGVGNDVHVVDISGGTLWHTLRDVSGSWQRFFGNVNDQEGNDPGLFSAVGAGAVGNELHVVRVLEGQIWHTIRFADGTWQTDFGDVNAQQSNNPGPFTDVAAAGVGDEIHVVGVVNGRIWHTIRRQDGNWQGYYGDVNAQQLNDPGPFTAAAAAGVGDQLHIVGVVGGRLWHTIRLEDGSWQGFYGDVNAELETDPGPFVDLAAAGLGDQLHVVGVASSRIWHQFRVSGGSWQGVYGDVYPQEAGFSGPFFAVGAAGIGGELHVLAVDY